ncbi:hypothetical protein ATSB10_00940 [Dyella thiooxydans]|uniref:Uncharacterized protein n=1 Tax=Dyella thiooxydans TaxID=445710 RepID=A0A160MXS3_9GAMM|nr:hypothetical protein ATSB10_00940 [Dyella thiooxydans]
MLAADEAHGRAFPLNKGKRRIGRWRRNLNKQGTCHRHRRLPLKPRRPWPIGMRPPRARCPRTRGNAA